MSDNGLCRFVECKSSYEARGVFERPGAIVITEKGQLPDWLFDQIESSIMPLMQRDMLRATFHFTKRDGHTCDDMSETALCADGQSPLLEEIRGKTVRYHIHLRSPRMRDLVHIRNTAQPMTKPARFVIEYRIDANVRAFPVLANAFQPRVQQVDGSMPIALLPILARQRVCHLLNSNTDFRRTFTRSRRELWITTAIRFGDTDGAYIRIDDNNCNIDTVSDLFPNRDHLTERTVRLLVSLSFQGRHLSSIGDGDETLDSVAKRVIAVTPSPIWHIYRIGSYVGDPTPPRRDHQVEIAQPAFAYYTVGTKLKFYLYTAYTYKFPRCLIGNHLEDKNFALINNHEDIEFNEDFRNAEDMKSKQLQEDIRIYTRPEVGKEWRQQRIGDRKDQLPFTPTYCFNNLQWQLYDLGVSAKHWPAEQKVHLAIRCIAHVDMPYVPDTIIPMLLPQDIRITVQHTIDAAVIRSKIRHVLRQDRPASATEYRSAALFHPPNRDRWELQLWALPQSPAELKLYRFGGESTRELRHFFHQATVEAEDTRLYMEAHIMPKRGKDPVKGNRLVTGTLFQDQQILDGEEDSGEYDSEDDDENSDISDNDPTDEEIDATDEVGDEDVDRDEGGDGTGEDCEDDQADDEDGELDHDMSDVGGGDAQDDTDIGDNPASDDRSQEATYDDDMLAAVPDTIENVHDRRRRIARTARARADLQTRDLDDEVLEPAKRQERRSTRTTALPRGHYRGATRRNAEDQRHGTTTTRDADVREQARDRILGFPRSDAQTRKQALETLDYWKRKK